LGGYELASRYFPFSQEFNSDAEGWELTDTFGDRSIRIWIEILAILDRERNNWKLVEGWDSVISRKVRQSPATVSRVVGWMSAKSWLEVRQVSTSGQPEVLYAPNFAKYRKTAAEPKLSPNPPNPPNLTDLHQNEDPPLTPHSESAQPDGFAAFWMAYPKKVAKGNTEKA